MEDDQPVADLTLAEQLLAADEYVPPPAISSAPPSTSDEAAEVGAVVAAAPSGSAKASGSMAPPPPPSSAGSEGGRKRRGKPLASVDVPGGRLSYFANGNFQAECVVPDHKACILTRAGTKAVTAKKGRPLGLMMQWLACAGLCDTRADHWHEDCLLPSRERRRYFREELALVPGAEALFIHEKGWTPEGGHLWEPEEQV